MKTIRLFNSVAPIALIAGLTQPALADAPIRQSIDANGVDLINKSFNLHIASIGVGDSNGSGMNYTATRAGGGPLNNYVYYLYGSTARIYIQVYTEARSFSLVDGAYVADNGDGATLVRAAQKYVYTDRNGVVATFADSSDVSGTTAALISRLGYIEDVKFPNGTKWTFHYKQSTYVYGGTTFTSRQVQSITNNYGYQVKFDQTGALPNGPEINKVTVINNAIDYCNPAADTCTLAHSWPSVSFAYANYDSYAGTTRVVSSVTDTAGNSTSFTYSGLSPRLATMRRPGSTVDDLQVGYYADQFQANNGGYKPGNLSSVSWHGNTWLYNFSTTGTDQTTTVTDPGASSSRIVVTSMTDSTITSDTSAAGKKVSYSYYPDGLLRKITYPELNYDTIDYDGNYADGTYTGGDYTGRGNIVHVSQHPKPNQGGGTIDTYATYASGCSNMVSCNQPASTTDEHGAVTDYSYDPTTGLLVSVQLPAPDAAANTIRPTTNYHYTPFEAHYQKSNPNTIIASGEPIFLVDKISTCATATSCTNSSNEVRTTISYGSQSGTANNLLPVSTSTGAGDNSLTATTSATYDDVGNIKTSTDALGNISYAYYDSNQQQIWAIGPDPDDNGTLRHRGVKIDYNIDGTVASMRRGAVDTDTNNWVELQRVDYGRDPYGRTITQTLLQDSIVYSRTDQSYDPVGRIKCTAIRLNPSAAGSTDACSQALAGNDGPDRIALQDYDAVGRPLKTTDGYATTNPSQARVLVTNSYTDNGKLRTVADGNNNITTYDYDGFDRPSRTSYPNPAGGDYEELTYGTSGTELNRVTSRRLRDGYSIGYTHDGLGRVLTMTPPPHTGNDHQIAYTYDLLSRPLTVTEAVNGHNVSYQYDALGRTTKETSSGHDKIMGYNLAGQMTSLNYGESDGYWVQYRYNHVGELTDIYENGATQLAQWGSDDLGRRIWGATANGTSTAWTFDGGDRLKILNQHFPGAIDNLTLNFDYNAAGQITRRISDKDAYSSTDAYNIVRTYETNTLNQYKKIISNPTVEPTYDSRGNLTKADGPTYGYTAQNQLQTVSTGASLYYDAVGRLDTESGNGTCARFDSVGGDIIAERDCNTGATLRRYIPGPDNAPAVWYEGAAIGDRRWLLDDERGSVIAVTDGGGNAIRINTYDEYGVPGTNNLGRFGYTGHAWLPSLRMNYARARIYSPTLGRFVQTDPIGYGDGLNWYNYVGGDPINGSDPSGLATGIDCVTSPSKCPLISTDHSVFTDPAGPATSGPGAGATTTGGFGSSSAGPSGGDIVGSLVADAWVFRSSRPALPSTGKPISAIIYGSRALTLSERSLLRCNGASQASVNTFSLSSGLPFPFNLNSRVEGVTLSPISGISVANLKGGVADMRSSWEQLNIIAHEFAHHIQYRQGLTLGKYLSDTTRHGYYDSMYETIARDFAKHVAKNWISGKCR